MLTPTSSAWAEAAYLGALAAMTHRSKQVRGKHVSSWMEEDGCGVIFSRDEENDDEYLLIERHFEEPDDGRPYIETDDERFSGHFRNVAATLDRARLEVRYGSHVVTVTLSVSEEDFQAVAKAIRAMIPNTKVEGSGEIIAKNGG